MNGVGSRNSLLNCFSIVPQPLTVTIHTIEKHSTDRHIGRHSRKTKGKLYENPRILLGSEMAGLVGKRCRIFRAKASITGDLTNLQDKDVLIIVIL